MYFTSFEFIFFLIAVLVLYYIIPGKFQWRLLLIASYVFYAYSGFVAYIAATTVSTYIVSMKIAHIHDKTSDFSEEEKKERSAQMKTLRQRWLWVGVIFSLGMLGTLKVMNVAVSGFILPMGVSFYVFQSLGYVIDVYRGKYPAEKNFFKLALFISFFPQLIQGPISRFDDISNTLFGENKYDARKVAFGAQRVLWGFFKKLVVADTILVAVNRITGNPEAYQGAYALIGMFFYALRLYSDFTGGIDITIGIAEMLGIKVKENFERPFFSKSIAEYWRRWHITMGTWFRDYLFYPISVSRPMLNLTKYTRKKFGNGIGKRLPVYISTMLVWLATGLWHGASMNFVMWGLMNGIAIVISQELTPFYNWFRGKFKVCESFGYKLFQIIRTFLLMCSFRIFDCYSDVWVAFRTFGTIFTKFNAEVLFDGSLLELGLSHGEYLVVAIGAGLMLCASLLGRKKNVRLTLSERPAPIRYAAYFSLFLAILIFGAYGIGYDVNQFIYNQF